MRNLTLSTGSFDQDNTFTVTHPRRGIPMRASLHRDYQKKGDGIYWAMQSTGCIKAQYSDADRAETARLNSMTALKDGEQVSIDGGIYIITILGDYSDCAVFKKVA